MTSVSSLLVMPDIFFCLTIFPSFSVLSLLLLLLPGNVEKKINCTTIFHNFDQAMDKFKHEIVFINEKKNKVFLSVSYIKMIKEQQKKADSSLCHLAVSHTAKPLSRGVCSLINIQRVEDNSSVHQSYVLSGRNKIYAYKKAIRQLIKCKERTKIHLSYIHL